LEPAGPDVKRALLGYLAAGVVACHPPPPASRFPNARAAIDRMQATHSCSRGVQGEAKVDYFGDSGRVRGNALFIVGRPERVRIDVFSPFGVTLSTLTSDGRDFALLDLNEKRFFHGPARACNVRRFLRVPVPPHALVSLITGTAPVLVHRPEDASIEWERGQYQLRIRSKHAAVQTIGLRPHPNDFGLSWSEQRLRVANVRVEQQGVTLYDVTLAGHAPARMAPARVDPEGIDPDVPPSGPSCSAELPRRLRFVSEVTEDDVIFTVSEVFHNPPLLEGIFNQVAPGGVAMSYSDCAE
jgi:hypothetical protein